MPIIQSQILLVLNRLDKPLCVFLFMGMCEAARHKTLKHVLQQCPMQRTVSVLPVVSLLPVVWCKSACAEHLKQTVTATFGVSAG